jgi:hypothetical protein
LHGVVFAILCLGAYRRRGAATHHALGAPAIGWGAFAGHKLLAGVDAARTDFGVDDAIAGINGISDTVSATVVPSAVEPAVVVVTMMMMAEVMTAVMTAMTVMSTVMMSTTVEAAAAATVTTGGRGSSEGCGRSERDDYESKFTKHFSLHL